MSLLSIVLLIVFLLSAFLLAAMVLLQDESGDGLGGIFGGAGGAQQIGNRRGNILTRTTSVLGAIFLLSSFGMAFINRTPSSEGVEAAAREIEAEGQVYEWWNMSAPEQNESIIQLDAPVELQENSAE